jgi:hypothetical protein
LLFTLTLHSAPTSQGTNQINVNASFVDRHAGGHLENTNLIVQLVCFPIGGERRVGNDTWALVAISPNEQSDEGSKQEHRCSFEHDTSEGGIKHGRSPMRAKIVLIACSTMGDFGQIIFPSQGSRKAKGCCEVRFQNEQSG